MGAYIAASIAFAKATELYSDSNRTRARLRFCPYQYCQKAPDDMQREARCTSCGAPLKEKEDYFPPAITDRYLTKQ